MELRSEITVEQDENSNKRDYEAKTANRETGTVSVWLSPDNRLWDLNEISPCRIDGDTCSNRRIQFAIEEVVEELNSNQNKTIYELSQFRELILRLKKKPRFGKG